MRELRRLDITSSLGAVHSVLTALADNGCMRPEHLFAVGLLAAGALGVSVAQAPAAFAQGPHPKHNSAKTAEAQFLRFKAETEARIIARQVQLDALDAEVATSPSLAASDRSALQADISAAQAFLSQLATQAAQAGSIQSLRGIYAQVVQDRIYAVLSVQVSLVISADADSALESGLTQLASELQSLVGELGSPWAIRTLADMTARVSSASTLTSGVAAGALSLTASGYPGNESEIGTWRSDLAQARADLSQAERDVARIEHYALSRHHFHLALGASAGTAQSTTSTSSSTTTTAAS